MVTPHNPTTAVFLQHDSHQMGRLAAFFFSDTCKHLVVSHPRSLAGRVVFVPNCLRAERKKTCLTSFRRALALSSGSRRRPAVAFRTTGVLLQSSSGTVFLAIFSNCRMVLPPCGGGRIVVRGRSFLFHNQTKKLLQ